MRVALVAGTLGQGGAEKQLVYMARALRDSGAEVRVYCLTRGEYYESALAENGLAPEWIGRFASPPMRTLALAAALRRFHPDIVQSAHFYTNLYVAMAARLVGAISIGAARNDVLHEVRYNGRWGHWLLRAPLALIVNSSAAGDNARALGRKEPVHVLPNVIDLATFDAASTAKPRPANDPLVVFGVGTFVPQKRFDIFLRVIAAARGEGARVRGVLAGDGPERAALEALATSLGLGSDAISFVGRRNDIPALLRDADVFMLTSDHEGFPNVVLEAMAASLPVLCTATGDARAIVDQGATGYVTELGDAAGLTEHLIALSRAGDARRRLGEAGRLRVEARYGYRNLAARLSAIHDDLAHAHEPKRRAPMPAA
jgi:glycosyltransferase involved in cell wall biosynthesis